MKLLQSPLAIFGICLALLGPLASLAEETGGALRSTALELLSSAGPDSSGSAAWIEAGAGHDSAGSSRAPSLRFAPVLAESELDEDLETDPCVLWGSEGHSASAQIRGARETGSFVADASLGARSARGPPRA